ncbi:MAG: phosphatase PAP2-related protein [Minisyncoccota bacterium]
MKIQKDFFSIKDLFKPERIHSLAAAFLLLGVAYVCEHFANVYQLVYAVRPTTTYVGDLLLDNLPVVNLNVIIVEGALLSIVLGTIFVLLNPRYILFTLKAFALLIVARALFVSLTHVGIYPGNVNPGLGFFDGLYSYLNFQTGFFFSGHTALPFLIALIFWDRLRARIVLLSLSFVFGVAVLLAHVHYSIDVLAAPFMAYGVFNIARRLFPQDYALIEEVSPSRREEALHFRA